MPIRITSIKKDAILCAWSCLHSWLRDHTSQRVLTIRWALRGIRVIRVGVNLGVLRIPDIVLGGIVLDASVGSGV